MQEYISRTYRSRFRNEKRHFFTVKIKETDLSIGIRQEAWQPAIEDFALQFVKELRDDMDRWIARRPDYARALVPCEAGEDAPLIFREMSEAAEKSGIGPMSAVAGAVAQKTGEALCRQFRLNEVMVENGGDIYACFQEDIEVSVFAGQSPLSEKVGLHIEAARSPLGICTSSGTVGPSLSFGRADAVMIVCNDTLLADTYATAFANMVQTEDDIEPCISAIQAKQDILGAIAIKNGKMGICGQFGLKLF